MPRQNRVYILFVSEVYDRREPHLHHEKNVEKLMKDFAHFIETHFFRMYIISCNRKTDVAKNLLLMVHISIVYL